MGMMVMPERQTFWNGRRPEFNATEAMIEKFCRSRRAKGSVKRVKFFPSGLSESRLGLLCNGVPINFEILSYPRMSDGTCTLTDSSLALVIRSSLVRCPRNQTSSLRGLWHARLHEIA